MSHDQRRDPYRVVGEATRGVISRAVDAGAPLRAWRVLAAVLHETTSYSLLEKRMSRRMLAELSGMSEDDVKRGVRWLREHEVLEVRPGYTKDDGQRVVTIFRLPAVGGANQPPVQGCESNGNRGANRTETGVRITPLYENHSRILEVTPPASGDDVTSDEKPDAHAHAAAIRAASLRPRGAA